MAMIRWYRLQCLPPVKYILWIILRNLYFWCFDHHDEVPFSSVTFERRWTSQQLIFPKLSSLYQNNQTGKYVSLIVGWTLPFKTLYKFDLRRTTLWTRLGGWVGLSVLTWEGSAQQWLLQIFTQTSGERLFKLGAGVFTCQLQHPPGRRSVCTHVPQHCWLKQKKVYVNFAIQ